MTPMIDVVFLLLIFFVCASVGQIRESLLPTELSAGAIESEDVPERERPFGEVWVYLRRSDGGQTLAQVGDGGEEYADLAKLERTLAELAEHALEIPVILDIAPQVPLGDVVHVYDACLSAGFLSISFAAEAG